MTSKKTENRISIDFANKALLIQSPRGRMLTFPDDLNKEDFRDFIPQNLYDNDSFTWDFVAETITVNQDVKPNSSRMMTEKDFVMRLTVPSKRLSKHYDDFLSRL